MEGVSDVGGKLLEDDFVSETVKLDGNSLHIRTCVLYNIIVPHIAYIWEDNIIRVLIYQYIQTCENTVYTYQYIYI